MQLSNEPTLRTPYPEPGSKSRIVLLGTLLARLDFCESSGSGEATTTTALLPDDANVDAISALHLRSFEDVEAAAQ